MKLKVIITSIIMGIIFTGCVTDSKQLVLDNNQQLKLRSFQIKKYNVSKEKVLRAVISTLQDLSFIIDKVDETVGVITATKIIKGASMVMTITVRPYNKSLTEVRVNAQFQSFNSMPEAVTKPETYQAFFTALDKSLFLEKQGI